MAAGVQAGLGVALQGGCGGLAREFHMVDERRVGRQPFDIQRVLNGFFAEASFAA